MRSVLIFSGLVAAMLLATTAIASARTEPANDTLRSSYLLIPHHRMLHHYFGHPMGFGTSGADMARSRPGGRPISRKTAN